MTATDCPASAETSDRDFYIAWILYWARWLEEDGEVIRPTLAAKTDSELRRLYMAEREKFAVAVVAYGNEYAASLSEADRTMLLDAMVGLDTNFLSIGAEPPIRPAAGGCTGEAYTVWARARRKHLARRSLAELAKECRRVLDARSDQAAQHVTVMAMAHRLKSEEMQRVVGTRYGYADYLRSAGDHCRKAGHTGIAAVRFLQTSPYRSPDGTAVLCAKNGGVLVERNAHHLDKISERQFAYRYARKNPPTA